MQRSLPKSVARVSISFIRLVANISVFANREQYRLHIFSKLLSIVSVVSLKPSDSNLYSFRFIIAVIHFIAAIRNEDSKLSPCAFIMFKTEFHNSSIYSMAHSVSSILEYLKHGCDKSGYTSRSSFARFRGITISSDAASIAISNRDLGNGFAYWDCTTLIFFLLPPKKYLIDLNMAYTPIRQLALVWTGACRVVSSPTLSSNVRVRVPAGVKLVLHPWCSY